MYIYSTGGWGGSGLTGWRKCVFKQKELDNFDDGGLCKEKSVFVGAKVEN